MRACWGPDPVEFRGDRYRIPRSAVGPKPYHGTIRLLFGALLRSTIERAAHLAAGVVLVAVDWDETRTKIDWYRDAGGSGTVLVNTVPTYADETVTTAAFTDAVLRDLEQAAVVGADEMHIAMNLGITVPPERRVELLGALGEQVGLAPV